MRFRFAALLLCLSLPTLAAALDPAKALTQYATDVWRLQEGLPHNSVTSIAQTPDGRIWIGTEEGLARFDGLRFTPYGSSNTPQIRNQHVLALLTDRAGALWVGTYGGGVQRYQDGAFTDVSAGLSNLVVGQLYQDRAGRIWACTDKGLNVFENGRFHPYAAAEPLASDLVLRILEDRGGDLWVGTYGGGLDRIHQGHVTHFTTRNGLPSNIVKSLFEARDGALWIGTEAGAARYAEGKFTVFTRRDGLPNELIKDIKQSRDGALWIATDAGLVRYSGGKLSALTVKDGLAGDSVDTVFEDREGSLWLGILGAGLERLRDGKFLTYTVQQGLAHDLVRVVLEDRDGAIWIGTRGGGLDRLRDGKFEHFGAAQGLTSDSVFALAQTADGTVWAGTRHGLFTFDKGRFRRLELAGTVAETAIWAVLQDHEGTVWVGTGGQGLVRIRGNEQQRFTTADGLTNDAVPLLFEDRQRRLWIGTDGGMDLYSAGKIAHYAPLAGAVALSMLQDPGGTLWIGTHGGGLLRLRDDQVTTYTQRDGLLDDVIFTILADRKDNFWFSSQRGVFRIARKDLEGLAAGRGNALAVVDYGAADGMKSSECSGGTQPAAWIARDGRFWYATRRGVAIIEPEKVLPEPPPPTFLEAVAINRRSWTMGQLADVPPGAGQLAFHYSALDLTDGKDVHFRYKLDGFDKDWVDAGTRRDAFYTNIPPGDYNFVVQAANGEGTWSLAPANFQIVLRPHFYQTRWFYAACILAVLLVAFGFYRLRVSQLKERETELKKKVEEAMANLRTLSGLLPICAGCKKIRDDQGYWEHIETYIRSHSRADFTHGMCPDCIQRMYPDEWAKQQAAKLKTETKSAGHD
jgi:ligand-binding sensor domain-containing protein